MIQRRFVPVIGLVGGIGSGKSALAGWLAGNRSVVVVDADEVGHRLLQQPEIQQQIRHRFGAEVFDGNRQILRKELAKQVFGASPRQSQARADLERMLHPEMKKSFQGTIDSARASNECEAVILDAAVLIEAGWYTLCDAVVFIEAAAETRFQRLQRNRGWTREKWHSRESSQMSLESKKQRADFVIANTGTTAEAGKKLETILLRVIRQS